MRDQYMRHGQGFVVMYSMTSRSSFDEVTTFVEQICRVKDADPREIPIVIVAYVAKKVSTDQSSNKCDLTNDRQVTADEGRALAQQYDFPFFEASAKLRVNTDQQFFELMKEVAYKCYAKPGMTSHKKKDKCVLQ